MGMRIDPSPGITILPVLTRQIVVFGWDTGFDAGCSLFDTSVTAPTTIVMLRNYGSRLYLR